MTTYTNEPQIAQIEGPDGTYPVYSTVTVEQVDATGVADDLAPLVPTPPDDTAPSDGSDLTVADEPPVPEFPFPGLVDPYSLLGTGTPVFLLVIHAIDPPIGGGVGAGSDGPGDPDYLDSALGFTIRASGEYENVSVPIFPIDGPVTARDRVPEGGTFPPNPDGDTDVVPQLWTFTTDGKITPFGPDIEILETDAGPIRDSAAVTALDQKPGLPPLTAGESGFTTLSTSSGW